MKSKAFRSAFPHTLPVMAGYLFLGMGFGILLESNGYSFIWAFFMSIFIYAGSMQYVAIDLLASGANLISTAIMTLMIQVRHLFYGLSIIDKYKDTGKKKLRDTSAGLKALESLCKYLGFNSENKDAEYRQARIITISNLDDEKI